MPAPVSTQFTRLVSACAVVLLTACGGDTPASSVAPSSIAPSQRSLASPVSADLKPVIEALFLGTGPMARLDSPGCDNTLQRMRGWPRGSRVHVVAYASVDGVRREAVQRTLAQANEVFGSLLTADYQTRDDVSEPDGSPDSQIAVFAVAASRVPSFCGGSAANCQVVRYNSGAYISSRVVLSAPFTAASDGIVSHELGHAFGLCHIDPTRVGLESTLSIMGNSVAGQWTAIDYQAIRLVYGAGLSPGDPRQQFVAAGLID